MYKGKTILALIPARGGSKGLKRKNVRKICGKPLISWTIEAAKKSKYIDRLILSSDDNEIIEISQKWGCEVPFVRPKELSTDETPGIDPVLHAIQTLPEKYDFIVMLQPTSPLRLAEDIDACIKQCVIHGHKFCVSVSESEKSPFWMFKLDKRGRLQSLLKLRRIPARRQDLPKVYALNGAVYVADTKWLIRNRAFLLNRACAYEMPQERSLDIDTELDLLKAEAILRVKKPHKL